MAVVTIESLAAEMESLRRENRAVRRVLGALVIAGVSAGALGLSVREPRVVEAERFVLKDAEGRERAVLACAEDGSAGLALRDDAGKDRLRARIDFAGKAVVELIDEEGRPSGTLSAGVARTGNLWIADGKGATRAYLGAWQDGSSGLFVYDPAGRRRAQVAVAKDGAPFVDLFDAKLRNRIGMSVLERGSAGLSLFDSKGRSRAGLVVETDDSASLRFHRAEVDREHVVVQSRADGSGSFAIHDAEGRPLLAAATTTAGDSGINAFTSGQPIPAITLGVRANGDANLAFNAGEAQSRVELGVGRGNSSRRVCFLALRGPAGASRIRMEAPEGIAAGLAFYDESGALAHKVP